MDRTDQARPGWRLSRALIEEADRAYHWHLLETSGAETKSDFVGTLLEGALKQWWAWHRKRFGRDGPWQATDAPT